MIDPKELRLGNWIVIDDGPYTQVDIATLTALLENPKYTRDFYHPIPITPEWLERLGAAKDGADSLYFIVTPEYDYPGKYIELHFTPGMRLAMWAGKDTDGLIIEYVRYVHQLQNLYYSLTGEELQIKEKTN